MNKRVITYIICFSGFLLQAGFTMPVSSQDDEFMLTFRHPAVGGYYVSAIHSGEMVYLPVAELLSLLYIHNEKGATGFSLRGIFPDDTPWELDPGQLIASSGKSDYTLNPEDIRIGAMDVFLAPEIYEQLFGLVFTVNLSTLSLSLQSEHPLPVEDRNKRDRLRRDLERRRSDRPDYPLYFPRERELIGAGMLDWSLGTNLNNAGESMNYNILGGMEFLGGDLQGAVNGFVTETSSRTNINNLHWRYALDDNPWLTAVRAGQMSTSGLQNRRIIGGAITNDPIMPRRIYDTYVIDGNTVPDSEVELYVNNQLSDFTRADELGYYRFDYPLNYGTARINTRIYTPSGQIIVEEKQLQIPFTFLPRGVMSYNFQGGYLDENMGFETSDLKVMHGDVAYGIANGLTVKIGTDYLSSEVMPLYYGSISTRIFSQYLFNIDAAPGNFYRSNFSVTFPNNRSFNINYTEYDGAGKLYYANMNREMGANLYLPVRFFSHYSGFRFGGEHRIMLNDNKITNYRLDFNTRIGRTNLRLNYRESIRSISDDITNYENSLATASVTYYLSRTPGLPVFIRGMFVRVQADYAVRSSELMRTGIQLSRSIPHRGRFQISADYDLLNKTLLMQGTLSIDLQPLRSSTQMTVQTRQYNFSQNFTGSLALDAGHKQLVTSNRNQVGQSAASIRMFVDANENGLFDAGEEIVPARAVRLDKGATIHLGKDSIQRISQIQSYWRYNAEIVQSALPNPMLAPLFTEFSFEADPNRYKLIDIPLYRTGVIDGLVMFKHTDGKQHGLGGLRLILKHATSEQTEILRSFSDGGFYAMNLLPGNYTLEVDPVQLSFLNAKSEPEKINFEIKALSNGDYIEGLNLIMIANETGASDEKDNQQIRPVKLDVPMAFDTLEIKGPYTVQLLALRGPLQNNIFLPSDSVTIIEGSDGYNRYISGLFTSYKEAQKAQAGFVKRGFSDAFIRRVPGYAGVSRRDSHTHR